jgi:hypothetical protein
MEVDQTTDDGLDVIQRRDGKRLKPGKRVRGKYARGVLIVARGIFFEWWRVRTGHAGWVAGNLSPKSVNGVLKIARGASDSGEAKLRANFNPRTPSGRNREAGEGSRFCRDLARGRR